MAKKIDREKYRKPNRVVRIRERLAIVGTRLAESKEKTLTELTNDALREYLERAGLWPPKPE